MIEALKNAARDDVVLLHGCCHNPSGADLSMEQWQVIKNTALAQGFTVFVDLAYQGMGAGLSEDVYGVRLLAESLPELVVVSSCSKNFGLYRERTGAVTLICESEKACNASSTLLASAARSNYSMPPDHGAAIVQLILNSPELHSIWEAELTEIRNRINSLRLKFAEKLNASTIPKDFSFIKNEKGMFSFLGASTNEIQELISNYGIYLVNSSRMNVASINDSNIDYLVESITEVLSK
jgi:aspartate aminotransferase